MFKAQKLVFSRRLTTAEVKKIESAVESVAGVFITDVKTHSVELFVEFNLPHGFTSGYNTVVNALFEEFKIGNALSLDGEGYVLVFKSSDSLQSAGMKQHGISKAENLF